MNIKRLITAGAIVSALIVPASGYAAETFKEAVKDSVITTKIKAEMAKEKGVSAMHIKVDTDANGIVQLTGTAKTKAESDKAVAIAKSTKGVTSVDNQIKINPDR